MIKRIAVFSLKFGTDSSSNISLKIPIEVTTWANVTEGCEALADKLGLDFCCTESQFDGNID